ncbi:MAG: FliM/FliN family flagellar motor switch protein [SAR324 cluster bacterium]|nr:FliM/FliN family flagellar motor switch protein [SAR324 cluster bacterium]
MSNVKQKIKTTKKMVGPQIRKLMQMPVTARLVLGECRMEIDEILRLGQGSMLELGTKVEDNLSLYINDEEIAKAKSVTVGDKLGAQIVEISSTEKRLKDLTDLE